MPSTLFHCKYCHQIKSTETALNRHIAHSARCFQSWQDDLVKLTSSTSNIGVEGSINENAMSPDSMLDVSNNDSDVEMSIPCGPKKLPGPSILGSEETDAVINDARSRSRYQKAYPAGYAAELLGKGKTKYEMWEENQRLHGENEWAPFRSQKEWDLVQWLIKNVGQKSIDEYLNLPIASICTQFQRGITNLPLDSRARQFIIP